MAAPQDYGHVLFENKLAKSSEFAGVQPYPIECILCAKCARYRKMWELAQEDRWLKR
jgi:hypothetical protein